MTLFMVGAAPGSLVRASGVTFRAIIDAPAAAGWVHCPRQGHIDSGECEDCVHFAGCAPDGRSIRCAITGAEPVREWMTPIGELVTTTVSDDRRAALQLAEGAGIHHLLVVDDARGLVGVVCRHDLERAAGEVVGACMPVDVYATGPATSLAEAAAAMRLLDISCLPVVDAALVLGVITRTDLRRAGAPDV